MMHVMDALISHGCLIVDVIEGGTTYSDALTINKMWATSSDFFETVSGDKNIERLLPDLKMAEGAASPHGLTGFATYGDGSMQFVETRIVRNGNERSFVPSEAGDIFESESDSTQNMIDVFDTVCKVGKDVYRVAIAATNMEYDAFLGQDDDGDRELPLISGLTF
eukprot:CAMPEP_0204652078 /NCGR_PEP_ID=MMETSP0718-20130828/14344_1 /ASSEMBLY_ACC=CAM_ASM_000674 /TAXON_ID=230516 /ORGANISM="Chaetoceros curvisetus" /LENGTH=164 /DNA_ID=CAMNT_0051675989 /DNA_START=763 /DNA_END=1257 /DNA_ORIENTATION=+